VPKERRDFIISNELGVHARPASLFVKTAGRFGADIRVQKGDVMIDAKSVLQLLMLAAEKGTKLTVIADGHDAVEALDALEELITSRFGEE